MTRRNSRMSGDDLQNNHSSKIGRHGYAAAMILAQILSQTGAFALPALLPSYMARWDLSAAGAGWLVGAFFAAYVVMVPLLLALTDRFPARRVYLLGTGVTTLSHLGFAVLASGLWSGLFFRIVAGIGWAGTYMPGLKSRSIWARRRQLQRSESDPEQTGNASRSVVFFKDDQWRSV